MKESTKMYNIFKLSVLYLLTALISTSVAYAAVDKMAHYSEELKTKAEAGDAVSQRRLATAYHKGIGVAQDDAEAMKWLRKSVDQGNAGAEFDMGTLYDEGIGGVSINYKEALKWFQKSAAKNYAAAQNAIAVMYAKGTGVPQDYAKAKHWFEKAAVQGQEVAQFNLGAIYLNGDGVAKDKAKAIKWFEKAAAQGYGRAIDILKTLQSNTPKKS
jgi:TPR repeat protein